MSVDLGPKLGLLINGNTGETFVDQLRPFLRAIDQLLLGSFINSTTTTPPSSPNNGDAYLLLGSPTGVWSGHANQIAVWSTEICTFGTDTKVPGWEFRVPNSGWILWDVAASSFKIFNSGSWSVFSTGASGTASGDLSGSYPSPTVKAINGISLSGLATGILKNTHTTGVPTIAVAGTDYQAPISLTTTGSSGAATLVGSTLNIPQYSGGSGMVYPAAGIAVSTGSAWASSLTAPTSAIVGISDTQTLTNKSIDAGQLTGTIAAGRIPNTVVTAGSYTNANITVGADGRLTAASSGSSGSGMVYPLGTGIAVVSGGTAWGTTLAAPTGAIVGTTDTQTLTNKTVNGVTPTTMSYLDATSSIQTQLNSKGSGTVTSVTSADANATVATTTTTPVITIVSAPKLMTARNINGVAFDGTASITVAAAAGTLTGSTLAAGVSVPASQVTGLATSATTNTTNATNITSGTLSSSRLPTSVANCSAGISLAPSSPNNFSVAHSLGVTPKAAIIEMTSGGQIWLQTPTSYDTTNVYLVASDAGVTGSLKLLY